MDAEERVLDAVGEHHHSCPDVEGESVVSAASVSSVITTNDVMERVEVGEEKVRRVLLTNLWFWESSLFTVVVVDKLVVVW